MSAALSGREQGRSKDADDVDVARAAAGDRTAFERLYRCHVGQVWSLARRLAGAEQADDLTQEAFLQAWRKLPLYRGTGAFGAWLMTVARNLMITRIARSPETRDARVAVPTVVVPPDPLSAVALDAAIDRLPPRARRVLVLRHFGGCTHEEIARLLHIEVGTSKSQLHRARTLLRLDLGGTEPDDE